MFFFFFFLLLCYCSFKKWVPFDDLGLDQLEHGKENRRKREIGELNESEEESEWWTEPVEHRGKSVTRKQRLEVLFKGDLDDEEENVVLHGRLVPKSVASELNKL